MKREAVGTGVGMTPASPISDYWGQRELTPLYSRRPLFTGEIEDAGAFGNRSQFVIGHAHDRTISSNEGSGMPAFQVGSRSSSLFPLGSKK